MRAKSGHYSPKVKADAALDACRETKTLSELSVEYGASSMQISRWKQVLIDRAVELFETSKPVDIEKITDPLYSIRTLKFYARLVWYVFLTVASSEASTYQDEYYNARRKVDGRIEAKIIQIACGPAPEGHARWSLRLLESTLKGMCVELDIPELSDTTIRRTLKKRLTTSSKPILVRPAKRRRGLRSPYGGHSRCL